MIAETALVANGMFFHYCHKAKSLMVLRIHHKSCPLCLQKNPEYISNKLVHTVTDMDNGNLRMTFADIQLAVDYIQKHPNDNLALGDTGYAE